jgi:aspartate/methionine/tyrosine aminotransferase
MKYHRMPIEIEAPEGFGYDKIDCNLSESSVTDQKLSDLGIDLSNLTLFYGDHLGLPHLRETITKDTRLSSNEVLTTAGAAAALFIVATSMLDKGDHAVIVKTNYATNIETPRMIGADISFLSLEFENQFALDLEVLEKLITPKTKLVSLTYPHNPTGVMIDRKILNEIIALIERKGTYLLMDETYREMTFGEALPVAASLSDRVISVSSMSKAYGLPGIRIGWLLCQNKKLMETFLAAKEQIFITNSVIDEEIAFQYLKNKERNFAPIKTSIERNFHVLKNFMANQNVLEWVEPKGGCVCFPRIRQEVQLDVAKFHHELLHTYGTYVGCGHWFEESDRYFRIGYNWDKTEKLEKGLRNILLAIEAARQ